MRRSGSVEERSSCQAGNHIWLIPQNTRTSGRFTITGV